MGISNQTIEFRLFKELVIGGLSKEELLQRLPDNGVPFNEYAKTLFKHSHFIPSDRAEKVNLVKANLAELGL